MEPRGRFIPLGELGELILAERKALHVGSARGQALDLARKILEALEEHGR